MEIDVRVDAKDALVLLKSLGGTEYKRGVARALNRTAGTVRKKASQEIGKALNGVLKSREIKAAIALKPRARASSLQSGVLASGRRFISIDQFKPRQTASGITVKIGKRTYTIPHGFIAKGKSRIRAYSFKAQLIGNEKYRARRVRRGGPDFPAAQLYAPGVPAAFVQSEVQRAMEATARRRFPEVIEQEVAFRQSKLNG